MGLVAHFADFKSRLDLLPLALVHDGLLQRLCRACADDVGYLLAHQEVDDGFVIEATVCAEQSDFGWPQIFQRGFQKAQRIVGRTGVAWAQPEVGRQSATKASNG